MKITKENNELVLRLPLLQTSYDAIGEEIGQVLALVGVIDGKNFSINYLNDLGYKGDIQLGMEVIMLSDRIELDRVCKELGLDIWVYNRCNKCNKVLYGSYTVDKDMKPICMYNCK